MVLKGRRKLLHMLWAVPGLFFIYRYLSPANIQKGNSLSIPLSALPQNGIYMVRDKKIGIIQQNGRISALSLECTHLGCTLNADGDALVCPCHGSRFTLTGQVVTGPATKNLRAVAFTVEGDNVIVV